MTTQGRRLSTCAQGATNTHHSSTIRAAVTCTALLAGAGLASGDALLLMHDASLTSYLPSGATNVQDIRPMAAHRGTNVDGSVRTPNAFGWAIYANPAAGGVGGQYSGDLRVDLGHYAGTMIQSMPITNGPRWPIGISYNSRQETSGAAHRVSDGPQGSNWFQLAFPEIVFYDADDDSGTEEEDDMLLLVYGAGAYAEYRRVMDGETATDEFRGVNGAAGVFSYTDGGGGPDLWELTDLNGVVVSFHGFDGDASPAEGQIWKITGTDGQVSYIGDSSTQSTAISNGYNSADGTVKAIYLPGPQSDSTRVEFTYTTIDSVSRLTDVLIETKTGGTWGTPTAPAVFADIDYDYYDTVSDPAGELVHGGAGDLQQVIVTIPLSESSTDHPLSGSTLTSVRETVFGYYKGTYNSGSNPGNPHELHYVLAPEGARGYDWDQDSTFDDDELSASTNDLKPYAAILLEYDSGRTVRSAFFNGECGCSGASDGARNYTYSSNGGHPANSAYDEEWLNRTIVEIPEGLWVTKYFDETYQGLSSVRTDGDPSATMPAPDYWATYIERDGTHGTVVDVSSPASVTAYAHSTGTFTVSTTNGLRSPSDLIGSGDMDGFREHGQHRGDGTANEYYDTTYTYSSTAKTVGSYTLTKPYLSSMTVYRTNDQTTTTNGDTTSFTHAFHSGSASLRSERVTTTLPVITTANNGSNSANSSITYFEDNGRAWFTKDALGYINHTRYNDWGQVEFSIRDANTSNMTDFGSITLPSGLSTTGTGLHRKTEFEYDRQGRRVKTVTHAGLEPVTHYARLSDQRLVTLSIPHLDTSGTPTYYGPVSYSVTNHAGRVEASGTIAVENGANLYTTQDIDSWIDEADADIETAVESMTDGTLARLSVTNYDEAGGRVESSWLYFDIPASLPGTEGTHYDETTFTYDDAGRRETSTSPTGTISKTVYDVLGRSIESWVGTDNSGGGSDDMTKVSATVYDDGDPGENSLVTKVTTDEDGNWGTTGDQRVTEFIYDYRNRRIVTKAPVSPHTVMKYDNTGAAVAVGQYSSTGGLTASTDPTSNAMNRIALSETTYDQLGRGFKQVRHLIDQSDGSIDDDMTSLTWFDELGRSIKTTGSQITKTSYDRLSRATHRYVLAYHNDSGYSDADDVTGDIVIQQSESYYDGDDLMVMSVSIDRDYDDYGSGETTGSLHTNADGDDLLITASDLKGRAMITGYWQEDALNRTTDVVAYGTYNGSNFDRDALAVPARSDTALRTTTAFNADGTAKSRTDPEGVESRVTYDDAGRQVTVIANYEDGTIDSGEEDRDQTTTYAYTDGLRVSMTLERFNASDDQVTTYTYGTTKGTSTGESAIGTGHLLFKVQYPDSSGGSDVIAYEYNALAEVDTMTDQAGNILTYVYDDGGRRTQTVIDTVAGGFDSTVRRIETAYNDRGMIASIAQYDATTGGNALDEVEYTYDDWGMLDRMYQDVNGLVTGSGDEFAMDYDWALSEPTGARQTLRLTDIDLPNGHDVKLVYSSVPSTSGGDNELSRVTRMQYSTNGSNYTTISRYEYMGMSGLVGTDLPVPDVYMNLHDGAGAYDKLDRFDRVTSCVWTKDLATDVDFYDVDLTYDRVSNITRIDDQIEVLWDEVYTYDDLHRLTQVERGTWTGAAIINDTYGEVWDLSLSNAIEQHSLDLDGNGNYTGTGEWDDDRTLNKANEMTGRDTDDDSTDDFNPIFDAVGNLTDDDEAFEYVYDPLGRLVEIRDASSSLLAEYRYNGLNHQIGVHYDTDTDSDVDGSDVWFVNAYNERWQRVATYRATDSAGLIGTIDSDPKQIFVWHMAGMDGHGGSSYIDSMIVEKRDASTSWNAAADALDADKYAVQNWRHDVVFLLDDRGIRIQGARFEPNGVPFGRPRADADLDGDVDSADGTIITGSYDVRGDINLDGSLTAADNAYYTIDPGTTLGRGDFALGADNSQGGGHFNAFTGRKLSFVSDMTSWHRNRALRTDLGVWTRRDPLGYVDGPNLYGYVGSPIDATDPMGLIQIASGPQPHGGWEPFTDEPCPLGDPDADGVCGGGREGESVDLGPGALVAPPGPPTQSPIPSNLTPWPGTKHCVPKRTDPCCKPFTRPANGGPGSGCTKWGLAKGATRYSLRHAVQGGTNCYCKFYYCHHWTRICGRQTKQRSTCAQVWRQCGRRPGWQCTIVVPAPTGNTCWNHCKKISSSTLNAQCGLYSPDPWDINPNPQPALPPLPQLPPPCCQRQPDDGIDWYW